MTIYDAYDELFMTELMTQFVTESVIPRWDYIIQEARSDQEKRASFHGSFLYAYSLSLRFLDTGSIPLFSGNVIHAKEHEYGAVNAIQKKGKF